MLASYSFFFFQAEDGIRDVAVTGVQTCALPILLRERVSRAPRYSLAVEVSPGASVRVSRRRPGIQGPVPAWRIEYRDVRRQLQLAGPRLDARQCPADPRALEPV